MRFLLKNIGAMLLGITLYFCQDTILFLLPFVFGMVLFLNLLKERFAMLFITVFLISYIAPTFWFIHRVSPTGGMIGLVLIIIPLFVYIAPMCVLMFIKKYRVELFILLFLLSEWVFSQIETGNTLLMTGSILAGVPRFIGWFKYTGIFGGSVFIFATIYLLYKTLFVNRKYILILITIILILPLSYLCVKNSCSDTSRVVGVLLSKKEITEVLSKNNLEKADYIITSESFLSLNIESFHITSDIMSIRRAMKDSLKNATVFLGAIFCDKNDSLSNAIIAYSRDYVPLVRNKRKFVPFGEYIPYRSVFEKILNIDKLVPYQMANTTNKSEIMLINSDSVSALICYESIFTNLISDICIDGAQVFFISASNVMINSNHIERIIRNITVSNAIIANRYFARSSENGLSYLITNNGVVHYCKKISEGYFTEKMFLNNDNTLYVKNYKTVDYIYFIVIITLLLTVIVRLCCPRTMEV